MSQLVVKRGMDSGKTYTFEEKVTIGSSQECDFTLSEKWAKELQLLIRKKQGTYFIQKQKGNSKIFLNGNLLQNGPQVISHYDILQIGLTLIQIKTTLKTLKKALLKNRYRLIRSMIQELPGGYYEAQDQKVDRTVMLYLFSPHLLKKNPSLKENFLVVGETLSRLNHDHLPALLDFGIDGDSIFFVYEYLGNISLQSLLKQAQPLPTPQVLSCIKQLALALRFCQKHNIAHTNVHPANILIHEKRTVLLGLGIDKLLIEHLPDRFTKAGLIGKLPYLSPEQSKNGDVTYLSDLFSLGVILFEMLTGQKPFQSNDLYQLLKQIQNSPYPAPSTFGIEVVPRLERVFAKLLEKNHNARYHNMRDLTNDLEVCSLIFTYKDRMEESVLSRAVNSFFFRWFVLPGCTLAILWGMWYSYLKTILEDF